MLRLVLFFFGVLLFSFVSVNISVSFVASQLLKKTMPTFYDNTYSGVFSLLDDTLDTTNANSLKQSEIAIRSLFRFPVSLDDRKDLSLSSNMINQLDNGGMVVSEVDGADYLYKKSRHNEGIWSIAAAVNELDKNVALAAGPINLIASHIEDLPADTQKSHLNDIANRFAFPVELLDSTNLQLNAVEIRQLSDGKIVAINPGSYGERYIKRLSNNKAYLQVGPIPVPRLVSWITPVLTALFFVLFALISALCLRPLWHDLRQLVQASNTIASGKLSARVKPKLFSSIRSVIDGFNRMADQTEQTIESQQALTNAVSHELRTPLARVKFSLEMAKQCANESDRERHLNDIATDVDELNQLVEELLTFTRHSHTGSYIDADLFPSLALAAWLERQILRAKRGLRNNVILNHHIDVDNDEQARFHSRLMSYAVSNGINNATKFAKTRVDISLQRDGPDYLLCIDDDGPGIPSEQHEAVFEPFHRLKERSTQESEGFGLGLSIIRKIVQWHNGNATITASSLGGNRLVIQWPAMQLTQQPTDLQQA